MPLSTQMSLRLDMTLLLEGLRNLDFAKVESCAVCHLAGFTEIREPLQDLPETNPGVPSCSPAHPRSALSQCQLSSPLQLNRAPRWVHTGAGSTEVTEGNKPPQVRRGRYGRELPSSDCGSQRGRT